MKFLKSFAAWASFTCLAPLVIVTRGPRLTIADVTGVVGFSLPFLLIPALGSLVLCLPMFGRDTSGKGMLAGVLLGIFLPILLGFVWMEIYPVFENRPALFIASLLTAAPSAFGGTLAGWLRSRSN